MLANLESSMGLQKIINTTLLLFISNLIQFCMVYRYFVLTIIAMAVSTANISAGSWDGYSNHDGISQRLKKLSETYPQYTKIKSLARTNGGQDIWLLTIGSGETEKHPALAVVAGVEGNHLVGVELSVSFAEQLLKRTTESEIRELLSKNTFYIFPNMSPDASEQFFKNPRFEKLGNGTRTDGDRDGKFNEDPFEDLNKDGLISMIRVKDFIGKWIKHSVDEKLMVAANSEKGERGEYLLISEGFDNDKDSRFNEEGDPGVIFNRNFSFNYEPFYNGAGEHAVSETEIRAIADFLFAAKNVFAVFTFGPVNNLSEPDRYIERDASARIPKGILKGDASVSQMISMKYVQLIAAKDAPKSSAGKGDFTQWAYFHYGRYSFSTPAWWTPGRNSTGTQDKKQEILPELSFLQWAEEQKLEGYFVPWTKVQHPDFPDKETEVGGIAPFVKINPPFRMIDSIAVMHHEFLIKLAGMAPSMDLEPVKIENLGKDLYRVTLIVVNKGVLPTSSEIGEKLKWVRKPSLYFEISSKQKLVQGLRVNVLETIPGRGTKELSWLVKGKGKVVITAGSEMTGILSKEINL